MISIYIYSHLEDYIQDLYKRVRITNPHQLNKYVIGDRLNIGVYPVRGNSESLYFANRHYIYIDRDLTSRQRWQDFGHELCHVLWHVGYQGRMHEPFRELQEWQADNFMFHFCVPTFMLQRIRLPPDKQTAAYVIAETFNVEPAFAAERLDRYVQKIEIGGFKIAEEQHALDYSETRK